jgi:hypothetical protein
LHHGRRVLPFHQSYKSLHLSYISRQQGVLLRRILEESASSGVGHRIRECIRSTGHRCHGTNRAKYFYHGRLIVEGEPAGLATAIALRQKPIECVTAAALSPGIDKACNKRLMSDTLTSLASLDSNIAEADGFPLRRIRFANSVSLVDASSPNCFGVDLRCPFLHARFANAADRSGAQLLWKFRVVIKTRGSAMVKGESLNIRWLDGANRRWQGKLAKQSGRNFGQASHWVGSCQVRNQGR